MSDFSDNAMEVLSKHTHGLAIKMIHATLTQDPSYVMIHTNVALPISTKGIALSSFLARRLRRASNATAPAIKDPSPTIPYAMFISGCASSSHSSPVPTMILTTMTLESQAR
ncbi:hypothetical protein ACHAXS_005101 [Conticribra weissflogii]